MNFTYIALLAFAAMQYTAVVAAPPQEAPTDATAVGMQKPQDNYVPHATYPYADTYPNSAYDGYLVPAGSFPPAGEYVTALMPAAQTALQLALRIFAKVGLFLIGGVALLVVGGLFTTAVCSVTPLCTITFTGFKDINKDTMRSYVTPDNLSAAANFVQDAIGKYQRLQRSIGN